jgi:hypothetical protein
MLFAGDRMTPSHAVKKGTRYRYYVSRSLITRDRTDNSAGLRVPAAEIERLVGSRVRRWLLDPGSIYKSTSAQLPDSSIQQRLVARATEIGKRWPELPVARKRAVLTLLIEGIEASIDQIDIRLRPSRLGALLDVAATSLQGVTDDETEILSVPVRLHVEFVHGYPRKSRRALPPRPAGQLSSTLTGAAAPAARAHHGRNGNGEVGERSGVLAAGSRQPRPSARRRRHHKRSSYVGMVAGGVSRGGFEYARAL